MSVEEATADLERDLEDFAWLRAVEEKTMIPKTVIASVLGLTSFVIMYVVAGPGLLCNLVGFVYPAYASFKAIETEQKDDDTQWLTYWVVYAVFNLVETFAGIILFWFPFYYSFKFGFLIWLFLPNVRGAQYLYSNFILPMFLQQEKRFGEAMERLASGNDFDELDAEDDDEDEDSYEGKKTR
ncbi:Receptor expression-enhancing protein 5 [Hondaea fermentalgiana]|uniref:Receptor expression-enhancing protein 5 n=1 Tax=Hondaea fermentalgiana TaxID=2315210 RepID=A0A2R5G842_9STRA|nr:Receptor expression-enhancing protein 5 [Hondaea fermentalgiana]|eukprot:GBG26489.1 Receptor expression-enhancing protein 5 [Hondaea fermentalgiana]